MNKFELNDLDINEINVLIAGLMELPGKASLPIYNKIKMQIDAQVLKLESGMKTVGENEMPWKDKE